MATGTIGAPRSAAIDARWTVLPYGGVLIFVLIYCTRPSDWIPGAEGLPFAKIAGVFAFLAFLLSLRGIRRHFPREVIYLLLLFVQLCLTVPFSPVWRGGALERVLEFSKVVIITVVMSMSVVTFQRLRRVVLVQTASVALISGVTLLQGSLMKGRLEGALKGDFGNPNDLALAIGLNLPLAAAFLLGARNPLQKMAWGTALGVMIYASMRTGSRGGFLVLVTVLGVCLWEFALKGRRPYLFLLTAIIGSGCWFMASGELTARFQATFNPQSAEEQSAHGSAEQRRALLWRSLQVTAEHPIFGVGPGNFTTVSGVWRTSHNSYTLLSSEGGIPALILYLMILWRAMSNLWRVRHLQRGKSRYSLMSGALLASLCGYLVGSFFSSVAYNLFPYLLVAYTTALAHIVRADCVARAAEAEPIKVPAIDEGFYGQTANSEIS